MGKLKDLTGQRFGKLTVIERAENDGKRTQWLCKCDCGKIFAVWSSALISGNTKSCGCAIIEINKKNFSTHNQSYTRLYRIWANIKTRCTNDKYNRFCDYGGRGITICNEWLEFENFYNWAMSNGYNNTLTIERVNNNANYEPSNCIWTTMAEQSTNKRSNLLFTYKNKTLCLKQWAKELNIDYILLYNRIVKRKWSFDKAITTPLMKNRRNKNAKHR